MTEKQEKVELLAPAGTPEKLEIAIHYGADAVYLAGKNFSLRNFSANFSAAEMHAARRMTREKNVRMYVAVNIFSRDSDAPAIAGFLDSLAAVEPDALIVADPAIFMQARTRLPHASLHVSTQANTTNSATAAFWRRLGAARVNAARELTLEEVGRMAAESGIEVEAFVHGAMCMAYSGRCLMSGYLARRESNRGQCCQPCRFHYTVMEETRPGCYFPIAEDSQGAYLFNSRDLCMISHLPEMITAGVRSLKIEGRMKSIHYLAAVVKVYREAIDTWYRDPGAYRVNPRWLTDLAAVSHRGYCTGFYFADPTQTEANLDNLIHPGYRFVGKVVGSNADGGTRLLVKNRFFAGDAVNILSPDGPPRPDRIAAIVDDRGERLTLTQPGDTVTVYLDSCPKELDLIRCPAADTERTTS